MSTDMGGRVIDLGRDVARRKPRGDDPSKEEAWLTPYLDHLEAMGFELSHDRWLYIASFGRGFEVQLIGGPGGLVLARRFDTNSRAEQHHDVLLEFINGLAERATLCRLYVDQRGDVLFEATYPGAYEAPRFQAVLERFLDELHELTHHHPDYWAFFFDPAEAPPLCAGEA